MTRVLLFLAALVGGALNAVAGGGSFIGLPALIYAGVPPVAANATTTFAMWPASVASAVAYRREISEARGWLWTLGAVSLVGGLIGGELLVKTSDTRFLRLLPWLMLAAVVTFTFGGRLTDWLRPRAADRASAAAHPSASIWILVFQLVIATYGGYFGGGMGIMMLAAFSVAGMTNIHEMNGIKTLLAVAINGVALVAFFVEEKIVWDPGLLMVVGGTLGGYLGASQARRFPPEAVRAVIIVVGWLLTIYFFLR